jgi:hypothetical protein
VQVVADTGAVYDIDVVSGGLRTGLGGVLLGVHDGFCRVIDGSGTVL